MSQSSYALQNEFFLHAVQMARLFPDSKTFVDMKMRHSLEEVRSNYDKLEDQSKENLELFVEENFKSEENTLLIHVPEDWSPFEPKEIIKELEDHQNYADFVSEINSRMKSLCRTVDEDVLFNQELYSLIYLPNPIIIPGGRFKEIYYWDCYWILKGLFTCRMDATVKGILENLIYLVKLFGHIPNGGRTYYVQRSQPPLLIQMVEDYVKETQDNQFVKTNIQYLRKEFNYWLSEHTVDVTDKDGEKRMLFRYCVRNSSPRPESYFEDYDLAHSLDISDEKKDDLYRQLKTAAESGWDFSTRWFIDENEGNEGGLSNTKADQIIPVDLNSFLCRNAKIMSGFYRDILLDESSANEFEELYTKILKSIDSVLWDPVEGTWLDYDIQNGKQRNYFYPSNLTPLCLISESAGEFITASKIQSAIEYIVRNDDEEKHPGGLPTSHIESSQQWDFPNSWCPLEHLVVTGLLKTSSDIAHKKALSIAKRRVLAAFLNYVSTSGNIYEKYDASDSASIGSGGEYSVQIGFGWTNGVILDFFRTFGAQLIDTTTKEE